MNAQRGVDVRDHSFRISWNSCNPSPTTYHRATSFGGFPFVVRTSFSLRHFTIGYSSSYLPFIVLHRVLSSCRVSYSSYVLIRRSSREVPLLVFESWHSAI